MSNPTHDNGPSSLLSDQSAMVFPLEEYKERNRRLKNTLQMLSVDIYIGSTPENMNYFAGFDPLGLYFYQHLFVGNDAAEPILFTHKCEKELARAQCWIQRIRYWEHGVDPLVETVNILRELGARPGSRIGLEMENWYLRSSTYQALVDAMPEVEFVDVTRAVTRLRTLKSKLEISYMREAAHYSDVGFQAAIKALRPGVREIDVLAAVQTAMTSAGSEYPTLPFIIASGRRTGLFHGVPTTKRIEANDPVMIELTGVSHRYNSNIVRTVVAGNASRQFKACWEVVQEAFWKSFEKIGPGVPVSEIDRISRQIRSDYSDYIPARAGFGMGLAYPPVWAGEPDVLVGNDEPLEEGMVFSLEPSIAQYHGITVIYGYNILVTSQGAEILQNTPREVYEIDQ